MFDEFIEDGVGHYRLPGCQRRLIFDLTGEVLAFERIHAAALFKAVVETEIAALKVPAFGLSRTLLLALPQEYLADLEQFFAQIGIGGQTIDFLRESYVLLAKDENSFLYVGRSLTAAPSPGYVKIGDHGLSSY